MSFLLLQDLVTEFGEDEIRQLADRDGDGEPDPDVVATALAGAEAQIQGSIEARVPYPLPDPLPLQSGDLLRRHGVDIARFLLYIHEPPEIVVKRNDLALRWLREFSQGLHALPGLSDVAGTGGIGPVLVSAPPRVFTAGTLDDY